MGNGERDLLKIVKQDNDAVISEMGHDEGLPGCKGHPKLVKGIARAIRVQEIVLEHVMVATNGKTPIPEISKEPWFKFGLGKKTLEAHGVLAMQTVVMIAALLIAVWYLRVGQVNPSTVTQADHELKHFIVNTVKQTVDNKFEAVMVKTREEDKP